MQSRRQAILPHIDSKLRTRLRMFSIISLVMLSVIVYDVIGHRLSAIPALLAVLAGIVIGVIVSRMFRMSWHEDKNAVVSNIDWVGAIILALYVGFSIVRNRLIGQWVQDTAQVAALGLAVTAGVMIGRVLGMQIGIRRLLSIWVPAVLAKPERDSSEPQITKS